MIYEKIKIIALVIMGLAFTVLWVICAIARKDESCAPEKKACWNCGRSLNSDECRDCYTGADMSPSEWTPKS